MQILPALTLGAELHGGTESPLGSVLDSKDNIGAVFFGHHRGI